MVPRTICGIEASDSPPQERALLLYKTQNGAHVGDLFMSPIHTCRFCDANPFHYLTALQEHSELVARSPQQWMPWNCRDQFPGEPGSGKGVDDGPSGP